MPVKKIVLLIIPIILAVSCTCRDDNYDKDDHAANVARCLQSLEDGTAYEIDEALTAKAPWRVGDVVAKFRDGEGGYYLRAFLGMTKAGYYLVQDYRTGGFKTSYPRYNPKKITNQIKMTEPFALMSIHAVADEKTLSDSTILGIPSVCGDFTNYYGSNLNEVFVQAKEQGVFLDGVKDGRWMHYLSNGETWKQENYKQGLRDGLSIEYWFGRKFLKYFFYFDNNRSLFSLIFNENGQVNNVIIAEEAQSSAFAKFSENDQTIQHGYWQNGEKVGIWRKWDIQGVLIEEINYGLKP